MHMLQADVMYPLIKDQKLRNILCYCWGDYGLPPDRSSWALHVMVVNHYLSGAAYPTGGAGEIACAMAQEPSFWGPFCLCKPAPGAPGADGKPPQSNIVAAALRQRCGSAAA